MYSVHSVQCTVYTMGHTLHSVQCTVNSVHSVQYTWLEGSYLHISNWTPTIHTGHRIAQQNWIKHSQRTTFIVLTFLYFWVLRFLSSLYSCGPCIIVVPIFLWSLYSCGPCIHVIPVFLWSQYYCCVCILVVPIFLWYLYSCGPNIIVVSVFLWSLYSFCPCILSVPVFRLKNISTLIIDQPSAGPVSSVPPFYKSFCSEVGFPVLSSDRGVIQGQINRAIFTGWISVFRFTVVLATCVPGMHCS